MNYSDHNVSNFNTRNEEHIISEEIVQSMITSGTVIAKSPANIAFIKYWGQKDNSFILPYNSSFSMNLSHCICTVVYVPHDNPNIQELYIKDYGSDRYVKTADKPLDKTRAFHAKAITHANVPPKGFSIYSSLNFPRESGIASSAAYFSALTVIFDSVYALDLDEKHKSILSRQSGSGSSARSIPDGFVFWEAGTDSESSFAHCIAPAGFWDICDIVVLCSVEKKSTLSVDGHSTVTSSVGFNGRLQELQQRIPDMLQAFEHKDIEKFGQLVEEDSFSMHRVMMTQKPPLLYWSPTTINVIKSVFELRQKGIPAYCTLDAGANVHIITEVQYSEHIRSVLSNVDGVLGTIHNQATNGARIIQNSL